MGTSPAVGEMYSGAGWGMEDMCFSGIQGYVTSRLEWSYMTNRRGDLLQEEVVKFVNLIIFEQPDKCLG